MTTKDVLHEQLAISRRIVTDGHEVARRVVSTRQAGGAWLILTRFDPAKPGQSDRAHYQVRRFMAWKFAQAFVMTAETWLAEPRPGEEAVTAVGASRSERHQRIRRDGAPQWSLVHSNGSSQAGYGQEKLVAHAHDVHRSGSHTRPQQRDQRHAEPRVGRSCNEGKN